MSTTETQVSDHGKRVRLTREARLAQLLDMSWRLVREEGTDALTLPRLAEVAGVAKPVVYDHFGTRNGLLIALYSDFDRRQTEIIDAALAAREPTLEDTARVIATSYVECVLAQGREIPGVLAALAGSPELDGVKRSYQTAFIEKCRKALSPHTSGSDVSEASFWAMLGAAEALSTVAASGRITAQQAIDELYETIIAMAGRSRR